MKRPLLLAIAGVAAFSGCAKALAAISSTAIGTANVSIERRVGINVVSPLVLPTVSATAVVPVTRLTGTGVSGATAVSAASGSNNPGGPLGNATLTIYGQSGDAVSMAVPETFKVIRTGGTETLTVKTNTNSEYDVGQNGVVLGGAMNADTMSVKVGGALNVAAADHVVPGPYEGMLVVVVQYN